MTREEALNVIWLRCQHNDKTYEAYCVLKHEQQPCDDATLKDIFCMGCEYKEQEPCEDVAKERYEDLCEYFGEAKDILKHREDFKAWLNRIKWHIHKAEELSEENDDLRDQLAMRDRFQKQQHCDKCVYSTNEGCQYDDITETIPPFETSEDAISRKAVLDALCNGCELYKNGEQVCFSKCEEYHFLATLPPVSSPEKPKSENKVLKNIRLDIALKYIPRSSDVYGDEAKWLNRGLRTALEVIDKYKEEGKW